MCVCVCVCVRESVGVCMCVCLLTLAGPVAGSPRVMLGREGDVYRESWLRGPSLPVSL